MRAIVVHEFGGPEQLRLEEVPDPVPGPGQLLVEVAAAGVQFIETQVRAGTLAGPMPPQSLPYRPGREVGGTVTAVGEGVDTRWTGKCVAGQTQTGGGYASLAVLDVSAAHELPDSIAAAEAVSLLGTGRTAAAIVELSGVGGADVVLVESAAGAVGLLAVQLAKSSGAKQVIGLARGEEKLKLVTGFGADAAVDYSEDDWPEQVCALAPAGVTVVFDAVGGTIGTQAAALLADGGRIVLFGAAGGGITQLPDEDVRARNLSVIPYFGPPTGSRSPENQRRQTRGVIAAVAAGTLRPFVGRRFPLEKAAAAHAALSARETVGKTVLEP